MVVKKSLINTLFRLSEAWLIFSGILMFFSFFKMSDDPSVSLSLMIATLFVTASIGTAPFAVIKYIKKEMEKNQIGNIQ